MSELGNENKASNGSGNGNGNGRNGHNGQDGEGQHNNFQETLFPLSRGHWQDSSPGNRRWKRAKEEQSVTNSPPSETPDQSPPVADDLRAVQFRGSDREAHSRRTPVVAPIAAANWIAIRQELMVNEIRPFLEVRAYTCKRTIIDVIGDQKLTAKGKRKLSVAESLRYYYRDIPGTSRAKISVEYDSAKRFLKALNSLVKDLRKEPNLWRVGRLVSEIRELKHLTQLNFIIEQGGLKTLAEEVLSQIMTRRIPTTKSERKRGMLGGKAILWLERLYPDPNSVATPFLLRQDGGLCSREVIANGLLVTLREGFPQNARSAKMFEALLTEDKWQKVAKKLGWEDRDPGFIRERFLEEFFSLLG